MNGVAVGAVQAASHQWTLVRLTLLARRWWHGILLTLLASLVNQAATLGIPIVGALIIARVATGSRTVDLVPYLAVLAALVMAKPALGWLESWLTHNVAYVVLASLRTEAYTRLEPLAPAYTLKRRSGDIVAMVMADIETLEVYFAHTIVPALVLLLVPSAILAVLASLAWPVVVVLVPFLTLVMGLPFLSRRWGDTLAREIHQLRGVVNAHMVDSIQGMRELIGFGRGQARADEVQTASMDLGAMQGRNARLSGAVGASTELLLVLGGLAVLSTAVGLVVGGAIERYQVPLILVLAHGALGLVTGVANVARNLNQVVAAGQRYFSVIDQPVLVVERNHEPLGLLQPLIEFDSVTFAYHSKEPPILQDVSFQIRPGETVALVGTSGAGKTTCVNLLLRFWDPDSGVIRIGGVDLRDFPLDDLRQRIAVVQQDNYLFNTSIRENIRLDRPHATDTEVETAGREANIHRFIASLPDGYDTIIGERGVKLSGGQRQRIAIARAFLKNAPILVLDEATSNLDSENERLVRSAIARLMSGRTSLIIAHRLSTIIAADRAVVVDGGCVVASGHHHDLAAKDGAYRRLFASQQFSVKPIL